MSSIEQSLSGWGNYPVERCRTTAPATLEALRTIVTQGGGESYIPRGLGRSYGDAALNGDVILQTRLDRFLSFDEEFGVLECEAGVSLEEIIRHLLPRGWFLPTTPGTRSVTLGGAIAADVHGKNHHTDGAFGKYVKNIRLMTASGEIVDCSPDVNGDLYRATLGGMGLTGVIVSARIQLVRTESAYCEVVTQRTANLEEALKCLAATEHTYRYSVAWIDCAATGANLGRGLLMLANDAKARELPKPYCDSPLVFARRFEKPVPRNVPGFLLNRALVKAMNSLYYARQPGGREFVNYNAFFYPLDAMKNWNRAYGRRGFVQHQAFFPRETAHDGLIELFEMLKRSSQTAFLAVLKSSGEKGEGLLSFLEPGYTLALDFPHTGDGLHRFARKLDEVVLKHRGRLYLAKDALMSAEAFAEMYPNLDAFRAIKEQVDPNRRFVSSLAKRVGIVPAD
jgi:FAD/FMN-containing dehydrogenase